MVFCTQLDIHRSYSVMVYFSLSMVKNVQACPQCQEITNRRYLLKELSYRIDFLHVVKHGSYSQIMWFLFCVVRRAWVCPKFPKINCQYFRKGLSYCIICFHADIYASYNLTIVLVQQGVVRDVQDIKVFRDDAQLISFEISEFRQVELQNFSTSFDIRASSILIKLFLLDIAFFPCCFLGKSTEIWKN